MTFKHTVKWSGGSKQCVDDDVVGASRSGNLLPGGDSVALRKRKWRR